MSVFTHGKNGSSNAMISNEKRKYVKEINMNHVKTMRAFFPILSNLSLFNSIASSFISILKLSFILACKHRNTYISKKIDANITNKNNDIINIDLKIAIAIKYKAVWNISRINSIQHKFQCLFWHFSTSSSMSHHVSSIMYTMMRKKFKYSCLYKKVFFIFFSSFVKSDLSIQHIQLPRTNTNHH